MSQFATKVTKIEGVLIISLPKFKDNRGFFNKLYHEDLLKGQGIDFHIAESYISMSNQHTIRGMHFQLPPADHAKIVSCPQGRIIDVVVDIRKSSPTYGQYVTIPISAENHEAVYIPKGCAHGFLSLENNTLTNYLVSSVYNPQLDAGIHFDSFGYNWEGVAKPILSERDKSFEHLDVFNSPF